MLLWHVVVLLYGVRHRQSKQNKVTVQTYLNADLNASMQLTFFQPKQGFLIHMHESE